MIHQISSIEDFKILQEYSKDYSRAEVSLSPDLCTIQFDPTETFHINLKSFKYNEKNNIHSWLAPFRKPAKQEKNETSLIFGKDPTPNIVSIEAKDDLLEIFTEENGIVKTQVRKNRYWMVAPRKYDQGFTSLDGSLHYRYIKYYSSKEALYIDKNKYRQADIYSIANDKEAAMLLQGITYYKNMKVDDVSRFHFDLETSGLIEARSHKIYLISTTFVKQGATTKKLFSIDEFQDEGSMIVAFCDYLKECDPSIITGFNIYGFDFPYLQICADNNNVELSLGRDNSNLKFEKYTSKFRKDGSQDYDYKRCHIYGREIVDVMFVAYHFDFARKYERYALKSIIKQEGLEKPGRQFYDASQINKNWDNLEERAKIKAYCIDDADDSESLYKLMISAYFYLTPHLPKSFEAVNYSASGSQINSFLMRGYLQDGHSVPKADEITKYPGAISDGNPGIYKNVFKVDVASLYPSIMLQYQIGNKEKDPKGYFLKMVEYFTNERLSNKQKAKETGNRYYEELEQAQKIVINSAYGLLGATGLNFNYLQGAALVTEHGREVLKKAIKWATGKEYVESNG